MKSHDLSNIKNKEAVELLLEILRNDHMKLNDEAYDLGLRHVWVYYCIRCNYVWVPKDFDMAWNISLFKPGQENQGEDLIFRKPPNVCQMQITILAQVSEKENKTHRQFLLSRYGNTSKIKSYA